MAKRKRRTDYPVIFEMRATKKQARAWSDHARALHLRSRNEFLRRAADHALTCPLFRSTSQPKETGTPDPQ